MSPHLIPLVSSVNVLLSRVVAVERRCRWAVNGARGTDAGDGNVYFLFHVSMLDCAR